MMTTIGVIIYYYLLLFLGRFGFWWVILGFKKNPKNPVGFNKKFIFIKKKRFSDFNLSMKISSFVQNFNL